MHMREIIIIITICIFAYLWLYSGIWKLEKYSRLTCPYILQLIFKGFFWSLNILTQSA